MTDRSDPDPFVDLLADHDAGLPVDPTVLTHPRARTVLDALAATRAELAAVPPVPVPPGFAARWSAALAAAAPDEADAPARVDRPDTPTSPVGHGPLTRPGPRPPAGPSGSAPVVPRPPAGRPGSAPTRPRRPERRARRLPVPRPAVVAGVVLAAVLVVGGVVGVLRAPSSITAAQLGGIARAAVGVQEAGPFTDPVRREACLRTVAPPGLAPDAPLAGGRDVVFEGHPGVVLLLITGKLATFRAVVVDPGCGAGGGTLLADTLVGP